MGTKAVGVWKKVSFKLTKKGQDYVSDFTAFVWLNPDRGNRVANLVEVTGFTVGDGGYLRFPRKFEGVEFRWKNFRRLLLENADPSAHEGHHFVAHHKDEWRWNNVLSNLEFMDRSEHFPAREIGKRRWLLSGGGF